MNVKLITYLLLISIFSQSIVVESTFAGAKVPPSFSNSSPENQPTESAANPPQPQDIEAQYPPPVPLVLAPASEVKTGNENEKPLENRPPVESIDRNTQTEPIEPTARNAQTEPIEPPVSNCVRTELPPGFEWSEVDLSDGAEGAQAKTAEARQKHTNVYWKTFPIAFDPAALACWPTQSCVTNVKYPMTVKKGVYLSCAALALAAMVYLGIQYHLFNHIAHLVPGSNPYVMYPILGWELQNLLLFVLAAKYSPPALENKVIPAPGAEQLGVVIVARNSEGELEATIKHALNLVKPEQIFILESGSSPKSMVATRELIQRINADLTTTQRQLGQPISEVNHLQYEKGLKTHAQYAGTQNTPLKYKYLLLIDDDVRLKRNFVFPTQKLDGYRKGYCYPIRAIHPHGKPNLLVELQDVEYKIVDLIKRVESEYATVPHPHGAIALWDRDAIINILREHDCVFNYDDVQTGEIANKLGYGLGFCDECEVETEAPTSLVGTMPNLFNQRVRYWEVGRHAYAHQFFKALAFQWYGAPWKTPVKGKMDLCKKVLDTFCGNVVLKYGHFYTVYSVLLDYIRIPTIALNATNPIFWAQIGAYSAASVAVLSYWNWVKLRNRPDQQSPARAILTYPLYQWMNNCFAFLGLVRYHLIFEPNQAHTDTVKDLEKKDQAIWVYEGLQAWNRQYEEFRQKRIAEGHPDPANPPPPQTFPNYPMRVEVLTPDQMSREEYEKYAQQICGPDAKDPVTGQPLDAITRTQNQINLDLARAGSPTYVPSGGVLQRAVPAALTPEGAGPDLQTAVGIIPIVVAPDPAAYADDSTESSNTDSATEGDRQDEPPAPTN